MHQHHHHDHEATPDTPTVARREERGTGPQGLLQLQQAAGNRATQAVIARQATQVQRSGPTDHAEHEGATNATLIGGANATVQGGANTTIAAGGTLNLNAPMIQASGVLRVPTLLADNVVAASYSPGAGNVM